MRPAGANREDSGGERELTALTILDRYIARQFLFNALALLILLFTFIVAVDVTLNIDRFVERAKDLTQGQEAGGLRRATLTAILVFNLWGPRLLQLFTYTVGLALVGSMGFTLTQMVRHRELVAMMASGISLRRVARPILLVAAVFMVLKLLDHEFLLSHPRIAPLLVRDHGDAGNPTLTEFNVLPTAEAPDPASKTRRVFMAQRFEPESGTLDNLDVWERDIAGVAIRRIHADKAVWRVVDGRGGWDLLAGSTPEHHAAHSGPSSASGVWVQSLRLPPPGSTNATTDPGPVPARIVTDLGPDALIFRRHASYSQNLSWRQISTMLENQNIEQSLHDKLQRIRWGRLATVLSGLLSLIITMPFFLLREPKNMLIQSVKCAPVGIVSILGSVMLTAMSVPGLPPGFAAMLPVFILLPIAIASVSWVRT